MNKVIENGIRLQILMRNDVKTDEISSNWKKIDWAALQTPSPQPFHSLQNTLPSSLILGMLQIKLNYYQSIFDIIFALPLLVSFFITRILKWSSLFEKDIIDLLKCKKSSIVCWKVNSFLITGFHFSVSLEAIIKESNSKLSIKQETLVAK